MQTEPAAADASYTCFDLQALAQARAPRAAHRMGAELSVDYWPEGADAALHAPTERLRSVLAAALPAGGGAAAAADPAAHFEAESNFRVVAIVAVDNALCSDLHARVRAHYGLTARSDVTTVYHGAMGHLLGSITRTGLRGAAGLRAANARGVYTSLDFWEAAAYSAPDEHGRQFVLRCDLVCGRTAQGSAGQVDFGVAGDGTHVLTATCASQRILVPLHDAQLLIREIVVVRHVSETPNWHQVGTVRFYNQWQLWRLVHSEHPDNVLFDNTRRLVGEHRVPLMVRSARSPGGTDFSFGNGPRADQRRVQSARKQALTLQELADSRVQQAARAAAYADKLEARQLADAGSPFLGQPGTVAPPWADGGPGEHRERLRTTRGTFLLNERVRIRALLRADGAAHFAGLPATIRQISKLPDGHVYLFLEVHSAEDLEKVLAYNTRLLVARGRMPTHNFNHLAVLSTEIVKCAEDAAEPAPPAKKAKLRASARSAALGPHP